MKTTGIVSSSCVSAKAGAFAAPSKKAGSGIPIMGAIERYMSGTHRMMLEMRRARITAISWAATSAGVMRDPAPFPEAPFPAVVSFTMAP